VFCGASCAVLWWSVVRSAVVCGGFAVTIGDAYKHK